MKIAIIGSGVYGLAMANLLNKSGNKVTVWTEKENPKEIIVPDGVTCTHNFKECLDGAKNVYILTSAKFVSGILDSIKPYIDNEMCIILGSKGILESGAMLEEVLKEKLPNSTYAIISGPTFAVDIAHLEPLGFTIATESINTFKTIKSSFKGVKIEYSSDTTGVELSGVLKNVYAIGSGMLEGFNYGYSARCLYLTEVAKEIKSIFSQIGAKEDTILSLAGIGDLVLTCTSPNSRNYTFGSIVGIGTNDERREYLSKTTVEGYDNLKILYKLLKEKSIDAPILKVLYEIVMSDKDSKELVHLILQ